MSVAVSKQASTQTLPAIAKRVSISEAQPRQMVKDGKIPATEVGRIWWVFSSDVKASEVGSLWIG